MQELLDALSPLTRAYFATLLVLGVAGLALFLRVLRWGDDDHLTPRPAEPVQTTWPDREIDA